MHTHDLSAWTHDHLFDEGNHAAERGTRAVMWIAAVMMVVEIAAPNADISNIIMI